ncbi:NUDIX hydrolase [Kitasatospora sp. NBC_01287]|uniref:NUDIX domain-containing protein n=1 Tax=Kitasatospora sp. NBC_01287 TaxID=2903573 RepID=UPI0022539CF8|nr:NUDIX hydrolase [Kitasatospora sp. NBC_01287]MCX4749205.1 NUDIX hydrolase [Kitasatospora sp. NBC_01287]
MSWVPPEEYLPTIPSGKAYAALYLTDEHGHPLLLRSVHRPQEWQIPGGNFEHADLEAGPGHCAWREAVEETGLDLPPQAGPLLALIYVRPTTTWPFKIGMVFDGGELTTQQIAGIRIDPEEHSEFRLQPIEHRKDADNDPELPTVLACAEARRTGRTSYLIR